MLLLGEAEHAVTKRPMNQEYQRRCWAMLQPINGSVTTTRAIGEGTSSQYRGKPRGGSTRQPRLDLVPDPT